MKFPYLFIYLFIFLFVFYLVPKLQITAALIFQLAYCTNNQHIKKPAQWRLGAKKKKKKNSFPVKKKTV